MKSNYLNQLGTGTKALLTGLFLMSSLFMGAQCNASFTYTTGANGSVSFNNTSTGTGPNTYYYWNFGAGWTTGQNATYTFPTNGVKNVCLTIIDSTSNCNSTSCDSVLITTATGTTSTCNANFVYTTGANGLVTFSSTSSILNPALASLHWTFGDGHSSYGSNTSNTYTTNGTYLVCLTVSDSLNSCYDVKCDTVVISNSSSICNPSVVYFLSKDSTMSLTWNAYPFYPSNITNATWYWGDGSSTTGLYPSHTYSAAGTYSTCVTVSVSCGTITASYCYVASIFRSSENNDMISLNVKSASPTGINKLMQAKLNLSIQPNPSNGEIILELSGDDLKASENTVQIYNLLGDKVAETQVASNTKQALDLSNLANGTYLVKVNTGNGYVTKKISVQK